VTLRDEQVIVKKRWIALACFVLCVSYFGVRHAIWRSTPGFDGEFVFKNDDEGTRVIYKYGTKIATCVNGFCRIGKTRKDSEALFEKSFFFNDTYLYEIEYNDIDSDIPTLTQKKILNDIKKYFPAYDGSKNDINSIFETYLYLEPGPFSTCAWLPDQNGCTLRTKGSEKGPPSGLFEKRQPRKLPRNWRQE
jgi:hypothetical protein